MGDLSFARLFRLRPGGVECDGDGPRVGGVALLTRDAQGKWIGRDEAAIGRELAKVYGFPIDFAAKRKGVKALAAALTSGELARAQIIKLLLRLPDPPDSASARSGGLEKRRLARDLVACGLLKADADWDDRHPRTGEPPNPGWFAPASGAPAAEAQKPGSGPAMGPHAPDGAALAFVAPTPAAGADVLLAEDLSATALRGLATLAARFSAATILFDAIFVPSDNRIVEEGGIPGRSDIAYRWAHDETATAVTLKVLIDGQWRTLAVGGAAPNGFVYDRAGHAVARVVSGPDQRQTLVATGSVLDRAVADLRRKDGEPAAAPIAEDREPRLCPVPTKESETTDSANSIAYQEYVTGLPYPWVIFIGTVSFDGCDPRTGILLEAKAYIDFLFDENDDLKWWVNPKKSLAVQMSAQAEAALAVGRSVEWHAQTEKGYRGLKRIRDGLRLPLRLVVTIIFDPN